MCATCGCDGDAALLLPHDHGASQHEASQHGASQHRHEHAQRLAPAERRTVELQRKVLAKNDGIAERNRDWLAGRGATMLNLMSSPGAGKTTLLERTATDLARIGPSATLMPLSAVSGEGLADWYDWLTAAAGPSPRR